MKSNVYIFRGAPASGKGTLLPEFCNFLPQPVVLIEQDVFRWGFHLINREIADVTEEEHRLAHENTRLIYEQYLKSGRYTIVIEGLFTWDDQKSSQGSAKELMELARQYGLQPQSIVLKASKDELQSRNAARKYSVPPEEFDELYENVYKTTGQNEIVIDSTNKDLENTLRELKNATR